VICGRINLAKWCPVSSCGLQSKEFAELSASVAQLGRRVARVTGTPGALSETERALAAAQVGRSVLRLRVEGF
jgi:hypothetical protein